MAFLYGDSQMNMDSPRVISVQYHDELMKEVQTRSNGEMNEEEDT